MIATPQEVKGAIRRHICCQSKIVGHDRYLVPLNLARKQRSRRTSADQQRFSDFNETARGTCDPFLGWVSRTHSLNKSRVRLQRVSICNGSPVSSRKPALSSQKIQVPPDGVV